MRFETLRHKTAEITKYGTLKHDHINRIQIHVGNSPSLKTTRTRVPKGTLTLRGNVEMPALWDIFFHIVTIRVIVSERALKLTVGSNIQEDPSLLRMLIV